MTATGTVTLTTTEGSDHVAHMDGHDYPVDSLWAYGEELADIVIWADDIADEDAIRVARVYAEFFGYGDDPDDVVPGVSDVSRGWARWRNPTAEEAAADVESWGETGPRWQFSAQPADGYRPVTLVGGWD